MLEVLISKLAHDVQLPSRQSDEAAGYDVYSYLSEDLVLEPMQRAAVSTGLKMQIPRGYHISVRSRSGLAIKHGLTLINAPGTIDSDYRGEIKILMVNLGAEPFTIKNHERIAQLLIEKSESINFKVVAEDDLVETERAEGGFGSTGRG